MTDARLVLDGTDHYAFHFDGIGASRQSQRFGPERNGPQHPPPSFAAMPPAVDPAMRPSPSDGMGVIAPHAVTMDQSALARTVREVFDGGDQNDRLCVHNRSAPNALVASAEPLGSNRTLLHPAWTASRGQVSLLSGLHASISASIPVLSSGWRHAGQLKQRRFRVPRNFRHARCISLKSARRSSRRSAPRPRTGRMARPKNASSSTTGSIQIEVMSDNEPILVWSNPNPLSFTRTA